MGECVRVCSRSGVCVDVDLGCVVDVSTTSLISLPCPLLLSYLHLLEVILGELGGLSRSSPGLAHHELVPYRPVGLGVDACLRNVERERAQTRRGVQKQSRGVGPARNGQHGRVVVLQRRQGRT